MPSLDNHSHAPEFMHENMDSWFVVLISIFIAALLKLLFRTTNTNHKLPPGPRRIPIISNLLWLRRTSTDVEAFIRSVHAKLGPIITLGMSSRPAIFVADRSLAHQALVQKGAVFADRPPALPVSKIISWNQCNINSGFYGPKWRLFRRNLTAEILNPSRVRTYSHARKWVLQILMDRIVSDSNSKSGDPIRVMEHFQFAMFCLLVLMCFGDKLSEDKIKEIEEVQRRMILNLGRFNVLNFWTPVTKFVLRSRWEELWKLCKDQEEILIPLIRARKSLSKSKEEEEKEEHVLAYVDTFFDLELPEEKRKLDEGEMVNLCSEFLNGGTDTTSTALQWIMANLVKYPHIQEKLFREIKGVVAGDGDGDVTMVKEDDLQKMQYLKAVVLEGLRRHPPGHFVLPHAVTEDVVLDKYVIPKNGTINFMIAEMGRDPKVWEDPMGFKPERFMSSDDGGELVFDITGSKEIKMMPFGVGRRICPGFGLAMLHLEYFVANLVWNFEWKAKDGDEIDLSEKQEFTVVMKNPLEAHILPRSK